MRKNEKGITLIALVITIIVLLILAGVSIAMLRGDNGIVTNASTAKTETLKAEAEERIGLAISAVNSETEKQRVYSSNWDPQSTTEIVTENNKNNDEHLTDIFVAELEGKVTLNPEIKNEEGKSLASQITPDNAVEMTYTVNKQQYKFTLKYDQDTSYYIATFEK